MKKQLKINCGTGEDAYEIYLKEPVNLIVTDIAMNKTTGLKLIQKVRKLDQRTPIIVTSGICVDQLKDCMQCGADNILEKPFDVFDLGEVPAIENLYNYSGVIRSILMPPRIFIIRFCGIVLLEGPELEIVKKVILRLQRRKIIVILSDIEEIMLDQPGWNEIEKEVGLDNIFFNINDALNWGKKELIEASLTDQEPSCFR